MGLPGHRAGPNGRRPVVRVLARKPPYQLDGDVIRIPGTPADVQVRIPKPTRRAHSQREIAEIPPHELANAMRLLLRDARAAEEEELTTRVRRLFEDLLVQAEYPERRCRDRTGGSDVPGDWEVSLEGTS